MCQLVSVVAHYNIYKMDIHWHFQFVVKTDDNTVEIKCQNRTLSKKYWTKSKLGFYVRSTARVILEQALSIATCATGTHRGDEILDRLLNVFISLIGVPLMENVCG